MSKRYIVFHLDREDDLPVIQAMTGDEIRKMAKKKDSHDFAIVDGIVLKTFDGITDLQRL
jgi:hypothetical protein